MCYTGKTFAVRALQQMCEREGKIKIIIMDLNIPKLLSVDDPLQKLDEVFTLANEQAQGVRVSYDTDVTVPVTTAKKSIVYTPSPSTPRTPVVSTTLAQPFTPMSFGQYIFSVYSVAVVLSVYVTPMPSLVVLHSYCL